MNEETKKKLCSQLFPLQGCENMKPPAITSFIGTRELIEKVGEFLKYEGVCTNAVEDDALCDSLGCTYCDMAKAHAKVLGLELDDPTETP